MSSNCGKLEKSEGSQRIVALTVSNVTSRSALTHTASVRCLAYSQTQPDNWKRIALRVGVGR
jgi:hypothetical protein